LFILATFGWRFLFEGAMKSEIIASAVKAAPAVGSNFWLWLTSHDINWYVALATLGYIGLQAGYLIKNKGKREFADG
jgi:hypothetical protein